MELALSNISMFANHTEHWMGKLIKNIVQAFLSNWKVVLKMLKFITLSSEHLLFLSCFLDITSIYFQIEWFSFTPLGRQLQEENLIK